MESLEALDPIEEEDDDMNAEDENGILISIAECVQSKNDVELFQLCYQTGEDFGNHELTYYAIAAYFYAIDKLEDAKKFLGLALVKNPDFGYGSLLLGHLYSRMGFPEDAMEKYLHAAGFLSLTDELRLYCAVEENKIKLLPLTIRYLDSDDLPIYYDSKSPYVLNEIGAMYYADHLYYNARILFLKTLQILTSSDLQPVLTNLPKFLEYMIEEEYWFPVYFNLGYALFGEGRYFNAVACFETALKNGKKRAEAWSMIGYCYGALGKPYHATQKFFKAITLDPSNKDVDDHLHLLILEHQVVTEPEDLDEALLSFQMDKVSLD